MKPDACALLLALASAPVYAGGLTETQRFIDELIANPPTTGQQVQATTPGEQPERHLVPANRQWLNQLARQQAAQGKPVPPALYFVSFSIPEEGLKRLVLEADSLGLPVTVRGMVDGDMRKTANAMLRLIGEDNRGGIQIDPTAFATYGIQAVPALVVTCEGKFDRIAGNLALRETVTKVAQSGDCADTANAILAAHP